MWLRKGGGGVEQEGCNKKSLSPPRPRGLGTCPQLSQVLGPVLLVPEDCEASLECPLVGKQRRAKPWIEVGLGRGKCGGQLRVQAVCRNEEA